MTTTQEQGVIIKGPKGESVFLHDGSAVNGSRRDGDPQWDLDTIRLFTHVNKFTKKGGRLVRKRVKSFNCMHDE